MDGILNGEKAEGVSSRESLMHGWISWPRRLSEVETAVGAGLAGTILAVLTMIVFFEVIALITIVGSSGQAGLAIDLSTWQVAALGVLGLAGGWISAFYAGRRQRS